VLLAIYNPNIAWLQEQLASINNQTYVNMELNVCDDCSTTISEDQVKIYLKKYITRFPYSFMKNSTNKGTNKTFELLTLKAGSLDEKSFLAYCDQDDIWEKHKIETLIDSVISKNAVLAYSDVSVIDVEGNYISDSITKVRKRFEYYDGNGLWRRILVRNFISGCCMIVRTDIAKAAVPFETGMQHDRWIALVASIKGYIAYADKPLVRYRQHSKNQTGVLKNVSDKKSYIDIRLRDHLRMLQSIRSREEDNEDVKHFLDDYIRQVETRLRYAEGDGASLNKMISYIKTNKSTILFETIALKLPDSLFKKAVRLIINKNM
jgi:glycosyltransferase involved in cell wall biosynthesis